MARCGRGGGSLAECLSVLLDGEDTQGLEGLCCLVGGIQNVHAHIHLAIRPCLCPSFHLPFRPSLRKHTVPLRCVRPHPVLPGGAWRSRKLSGAREDEHDRGGRKILCSAQRSVERQEQWAFTDH